MGALWICSKCIYSYVPQGNLESTQYFLVGKWCSHAKRWSSKSYHTTVVCAFFISIYIYQYSIYNFKTISRNIALFTVYSLKNLCLFGNFFFSLDAFFFLFFSKYLSTLPVFFNSLNFSASSNFFLSAAKIKNKI